MNSVHLCAGYHNVTAVKFGINVTMFNSANGTYNITVKASSGKTPTIQLKHDETKNFVTFANLKPCTEYTTTVIFISHDSKPDCVTEDKSVWTGEMGECKR